MDLLRKLGETQKALTVLCLLASSIFLVYSVHFFYPLLYHTEEYDHLLLAREMSKEQKIGIGMNWEMGYHVLLIGVKQLTGLNWIETGLVFPTAVAFILSLSVFCLMRFFFRDETLAFFSALFALFLKSNPTVLGLWFLVPMAFGLMMLPNLVHFFVRGTRSKKFALIFLFLTAQTTLSHPAYFIVLLPAILAFFALNPSVFKKNQLRVAAVVVVLFLLLPFFSYKLGFIEGDFTYSLEGFRRTVLGLGKALTFEPLYEWNPRFYFPEFIGLPLLFLGGLGLGFCLMLWFASIIGKIKKGLFSGLPFELRASSILSLFFLVLLPFYLWFHWNSVAFLAPYARMFTAMALFLLMLAGVGFYVLLSVFKQFLISPVSKKSRALKALFFCIAFLFVFYQATKVPFADFGQLYQDLDLKAVPAVNYLQDNTARNERVLALPWHSASIGLLTELETLATPPTRAGKGFPGRVMLFFLVPRCEEKSKILNDFNATIVFSQTNIECSFLDKEFDSGNHFIYRKS